MKLNLKNNSTEIRQDETFKHTFITHDQIEIQVDQGKFKISEKNGGLEIVALYENGSMFLMNTALKTEKS